jgi:molybdate transport system substrate-binding protein
MENVVRLLSTLALMGAVRSLAGRYQAELGTRIDADFAPTLGCWIASASARPPTSSS